MELTTAIVGRIGKAHGIKGEVMVEPRTDVPELRFATGAELSTEDGKVGHVVERMRWQGERMIVKFVGVDDRNAAEALRGTVLMAFVDANEEPEDPEEFYDRHLLGLEVRTHTGEKAGTIVAVDHAGPQDLLVVDTPGGQRWVPFVSQLVSVVDRHGGFVQLAEIHGLIDDDAEEAR